MRNYRLFIQIVFRHANIRYCHYHCKKQHRYNNQYRREIIYKFLFILIFSHRTYQNLYTKHNKNDRP